MLVEALRNGYWIVLDELNLAPSDVLEALNRLLDDNRELYIPETQETIRPHPHFMLFATQNPAGQYGGRKQLSRAFRNRFLELHFSDIPQPELEIILERKCRIPPSYCKKITAVYKALQSTRNVSRIFDGKHIVTLRDLFRWALRRANSYEELARDGYMLLAERTRKEEDRVTIFQILESTMRVKLQMDEYYASEFQHVMRKLADSQTDLKVNDIVAGVVWTDAMQRLFVLIYNATIYCEPVLLVGDTGCGKTTVCQVLASLLARHLHIVNAHQNSETADFLGSQRPNRGREQYEIQLLQNVNDILMSLEMPALTLSSIDSIENIVYNLKSMTSFDFILIDELQNRTKALFEWHDGPLVQAMRAGDYFLLDEISLADDSVLERLNSVLEPQRLLVLVEKSGSIQEIIADKSFHFFATMNPGGDYGKKELSPALRNRFTEIWVPSISSRTDLLMIISNRLEIFDSRIWAQKIIDFIEWFANELRKPFESIVSLRDILAWANFIMKNISIGINVAYLHGGSMVLVDGLGVNPLFGTLGSTSALAIKSRSQLREIASLKADSEFEEDKEFENVTRFGISPFFIPLGPSLTKPVKFTLYAPTTKKNCLRILRAMQLSKPVLLEGSPGVGKTSLISSLASVSQNMLVRINLSEQTDLMDLFGSDLPVEGKTAQFSWRDGPFLQAMQRGDWILLDELNLASQQVLEGLNACLDHRATVYIPELDRHFSCHPNFRVFACQNPHHQGGGRKGLPKSFVNRFTQVYVDALSSFDLEFICTALYPSIEKETVSKMIFFNERVKRETMELFSFGLSGSPWEFNLRDVLRWIELLDTKKGEPVDYLNLLYVHRMRTLHDRDQIRKLFQEVFLAIPDHLTHPPMYRITENHLLVGSVVHKRKINVKSYRYAVPTDNLQILPSSLSMLQSILQCVHTNVLPLLVGPTYTGKTSLIRMLATLCGEKLIEISLHPGIDSLELLGGFEQVDLSRREQELLDALETLTTDVFSALSKTDSESECQMISNLLGQIKTHHFYEQQSFVWQILSLIEKQTGFSQNVCEMRNKIQALTNIKASGVQGQFEWVNSSLVEALEGGHWILLDNVNLCSSSVLDRLNSLLEVGGNLTINERGLIDGEIKVISPHPNFRIFMAMDPTHGEISRAMRNRSIELYVEDFDLSDNALLLNDMRQLALIGLPGIHFAKLFYSQSERHHFSTARLLVELVRKGYSLVDALPELKITGIDAENFDLQAKISPHSFPLSMVVSSTKLSNILFDGQLLSHFSTDVDAQLFNQNDYSATRTNLVVAALSLFFETATITDWSLRLQYVAYLIDICDDENIKRCISEYCSSLNDVRPAIYETIFVNNKQLLLKNRFDQSFAQEMVLLN